MSTAVGIEQASAGDRPRPRRRRRWFSWTVAVLLALWAVVRAGGWEQGTLLAQLVTVTPYGAALAALTALVALLRRNRWAALVAALACVAMVAVVAPRTFAAEQPAAGGPVLRVLTINLFTKGDAQAVVDLVRRHDVDVLSALELTYDGAELLDAAGLKQLMPHRVLQPAADAIGSGIYSRHPATELTGLFEAIGHNMPAAAVTLPGGGKVEFVAVHPRPPLGPKEAEWSAALRALPPASPSVVRVLAGDFNATLDHRPFRDLLARGYVDAAEQVGKGLTPTWPSSRAIPPIIAIDHVVADRRAAVNRVEILNVPSTDHRAVFAELRLP
ncbi:endonuclease/exonuclease/phosphatase (EEP) superfamily protein YafD [Nonomuraea thailandensis]|uniref:Endonuclease/exonuclease/phosphatase (EEP) superfamily protein YafD n=1 Tax=Nonomuraea thailandensis TaxID=1188745 RepID=A0A9X2K5G0_9ACTN|nr:endonuclease/exonuclease/phosphatase family protein [Nonomuraea thailandensis]MCP2360429.1 endonuclease/exonuclease/phosphatase (EEP) superfamily protein YafD [Nonomuraea thailandensis]